MLFQRQVYPKLRNPIVHAVRFLAKREHPIAAIPTKSQPYRQGSFLARLGFTAQKNVI